MEKVSLEQFTAEIETSLSNYAESNDIDRQSIKTWVIQALRKFGKNICEKNETVVEVKNSRALLPETFKSLTFAVKVKTKPFTEEETKQLVNEKIYIQNEAIWDSLTNSYITDYCTTYYTTEKTYSNVESPKFYGYELLALAPNINRNTLDTNCINLHPYLQAAPNEVNIVNRTLSANFKEGYIFLRFNSLPMGDDGEICVPILTTGDIYNYIFQMVRVNIIENIILNNKNAAAAGQLYPSLKAELRDLEHRAKTEAKYNGLSPNFARKIYAVNLANRKRLGL